jgi:hypothetical protein
VTKYDDRRAAKEEAYKGADNPFPEGSRLHRYFIKARKHIENMDAIFRDLEHVYGTIGQRRDAGQGGKEP